MSHLAVPQHPVTSTNHTPVPGVARSRPPAPVRAGRRPPEGWPATPLPVDPHRVNGAPDRCLSPGDRLSARPWCPVGHGRSPAEVAMIRWRHGEPCHPCGRVVPRRERRRGPMAACVIVAIDVDDPEACGDDARAVPATLEPFDGRVVVRGWPVHGPRGRVARISFRRAHLPRYRAGQGLVRIRRLPGDPPCPPAARANARHRGCRVCRVDRSTVRSCPNLTSSTAPYA